MTTTDTETKVQTFKNCTLYTLGGFGNVVRTLCREVTIEEGAKLSIYQRGVGVRWLEKGKRKTRGVVKTPDSLVMVAEGHDTPVPDSLMGEPRTENGMVVREGRYASFDPRYVSDFREMMSRSGAVILY